MTSVRARHNLLLDVLHKVVHLPLHLFHALAHLQDDGHPADIHAQVARQRRGSGSGR